MEIHLKGLNSKMISGSHLSHCISRIALDDQRLQLVSQNPSMSPVLGKLAAKYSMPARMWPHGIHPCLGMLRQKLSDLLEYTLALIDISYPMFTFYHETVLAFEDSWIECLGGLGRYRIARPSNILSEALCPSFFLLLKSRVLPSTPTCNLQFPEFSSMSSQPRLICQSV